MKSFILLLVTVISFGTCSVSFAADEPDLDKCMDNSGGVTYEMNACLDESLSYWDAMLNTNYKLALKGCLETDDPAQCKKALKTSERNWLKYRDSTVDLIYIRIGGTIAQIEAKSFILKATKRQAEDLSVYKSF